MKIITPEKLSKNHNVSSESDTHFVVRYLGFFLFLIVSLYLLFYALSFIAIKYISIEDEIAWFGSGDEIAHSDNSPLGAPILDFPEELAQRYQDVKYDIYLIDMEGEENAFASLGGEIYLTQSLLENITHYEALDMIVGHEIGHIESRDVLRGLITRVPLTFIAGLIGSEGILLSDSLISQPHSKKQESNADEYGLDFAYNLNGHISCTLEYFESHNNLTDNLLEIFSDHPVTQFRIEAMQEYITEKGYPKGECRKYEYGLD